MTTTYFRKAKSNFATTLVTGIGTGTGDTITLNSTTGLPTDTEIVLTFNRVTSSGAVNDTALMERIKGTISGATLTLYTRAIDGTTEQSHAGGTVVEYIPNAADINDSVDGILVEHNQDGTHNKTKVADLTTAQTLTNKTLTSPVINTPTGDVATLTTAQTLTNKTLTTPVINGAVTGTVTPPLTFYGANFIAPEGFLLNGKIVPSVASNNLTVALKGLDGNDPSASNPIYVRIGDTVRTIASALSVTTNAGTNWFNAGSTELATKETDYFVYLGYNATDGVVIGFARIPYVTQYDQFAAISINEKYCAISTTTNAAAGDDYTVIGRFAATLSAGAGYTWSVPTFTTINLIQRPIFESRWLPWVSVPSASGSMTFNNVGFAQFYYKITGSSVIYNIAAQGTTGGSASYGLIQTLPFASPRKCGTGAQIYDGGAASAGTVENDTGSADQFRKVDGGNWGIGTARQFQVTHVIPLV